MNSLINSQKLIIVIILTFLTGCAPLKEKGLHIETTDVRGRTPEEAKILLFESLNTIKPLNAVSRREVSYLLHSLKRVSNGMVESKFEKLLATHIDTISKEDRDYLIKRINYFDKMPVYQKLKVVDRSYLTVDLLKPYPPFQLSSEIAGIVCCDNETVICESEEEIGKLEMPEGSQGLILYPEMALAAVADGASGLLLINISAPANPTYFPSSPYKGDITGFVNDLLPISNGNNRYIIIASSSLGNLPGAIEILDVSSPMGTISSIGKIEGNYFKLSLSNDNNYAFSFNKRRNSIDIIDISDLSNIQIINSEPIIGNLSDLLFINSRLHILLMNGSSLVYKLIIDETTGSPRLLWTWGPDGFPCSNAFYPDSTTELLGMNEQSIIVKDSCLNIIEFSNSGIPDQTGISLISEHKHNSGTFVDDRNILVDMKYESDIRGSGSERISCDIIELSMLEIPEIGQGQFSLKYQKILQNEIMGIKIRDNNIYLADHRVTENCKRPGNEPVHFRIFSFPNIITEYKDPKPTINTLNGNEVYQSVNDMPTSMCGSEPVFCGFVGATGEECGTGYCNGGVCVQPPVLQVDENQRLIITGANYWDVNAKVLISNYGSNSWLPFDAHVMGDEFCEMDDMISVDLNAAVTNDGLKWIKIRNFNDELKLRTCANCDYLNDPECIPDFIDSKEVLVYFQSNENSELPGYDLHITEITAKQGSNGAGDLGKNAWCDDETVLIVPDPDDASATFLIPDEEGFEFQHNGEYENLSTLIGFRNPNQSDALTSPMVKLWETDDNTILGTSLLGAGLSCAGVAYKTQVCGPYSPYCIAGCLGIAAVGAILLIFDGGDFIASETDLGLSLTKQVAHDILLHGECAIPDTWHQNSSASENRVIHVSDISTIGGIKTRYITKEYICKECDKTTKNGKEWGGKYWIKYRISERN